MPKKGQAGRGGASKDTLPTISSDIDIVFTNASDTKVSTKAGTKVSKGKGISDGSGAASSSAADRGASGLSDTTPKRPDTRTLIGGASWTGKLPVNLLSEHCQKQRWEKPEYTMTKSADGFVSSVILKAVNSKTSEVTTLPPLRLPQSHKALAFRATAVEARHFAATYALFRVCSMRNLHMMLPPTYRDLWRGTFQELKAADIKQGNAWMYEANPFQVHREREQTGIGVGKNRDGNQSQNEKQVRKPDHQTIASGKSSDLTQVKNTREKISGGRSQAPKVDMGKRTRVQVESLIRRHTTWNRHQVQLSAPQRANIIEDISALGFRKSHVEEATAYCKDKEETLEWLLIHVPEDDLPGWSLPEGYIAGISMASSDVKREATIKRLSSAGYGTDLCGQVLDESDGNEARAAATLQDLLVKGSISISVAEEGNAHSPSDKDDSWYEEQQIFQAIFGHRYVSLSPDHSQIRLEMEGVKEQISVQFRKPVYGKYPESIPILSVYSEPILPAYIRLAIIKRAVCHAESNLQGQQMLFSLVDWLEAEIHGIIANPGKLLDVAPATSAVATRATEYEKSSRTLKATVRRAPHQRNRQRPTKEDSIRMLAEWKAKQASPKQQEMLALRQALPAWKMRDVLVNTVNTHTVTIISGETGSGKSTQSVQFILDDMIQREMGAVANIVCTQPRRISALGLADRVSDERCDMVGREIGYAIRGESRQTAAVTKVKFMTTGVLLRQMQAIGEADNDMAGALADVTHVFIDEVHERSLDTDFLLALLSRLLRKRRDLKVILMSATLDADVFAEYFRGTGEVGRVNIEGRTHPVEDYYLEDVVVLLNYDLESYDYDRDDVKTLGPSVNKKSSGMGMSINYDLIARTVEAIHEDLGAQDGGILIFLPGSVEIDRTLDAVRRLRDIHALPLHASLPPADQKKVFLPAPKGKRKVIACTNVAETSITIEDIVAVIDTGRVKETTYDPQNNMVKLAEVWASRAACKQRRGRAGRVRAGKCYKLFTRNTEMRKMVERPEPEIRRVPLEQLCLSVKAMGVHDVHAFLASTITPPEGLAVEGAMHLLRRMGALDGEQLTALGTHLARIPADLRCGKLMVYGATFGCLEACLTIAAILTTRSPFFAPTDKRTESKAIRASFARGQGDLLADLRAFDEWCAVRASRDARIWCEQNFLSIRTLHDILSTRSQYLGSLKEAGFVPSSYYSRNIAEAGSSSSSSSSQSFPRYNRHHTNAALLRALIAGSFSPQIACIEFPPAKFAPSVSGAVPLDPEARTIKYFTPDSGRVFIHPSSTVFDAQGFSSSSSLSSSSGAGAGAGSAAATTATTGSVGSVYVSFFVKVQTGKIFIREITPFNAYSLLLFSGPIHLAVLHHHHHHHHRPPTTNTTDTATPGIIVDNSFPLRGWPRIAVLVSRLRNLLDEVLARKLNPCPPPPAAPSGGIRQQEEQQNNNDDDDVGMMQVENEILEVVTKLVIWDGMDR